MQWKGRNVKDTHISLAVSITAHLCLVLLLLGLSVGARKAEKVIVVDLSLVTGVEKIGAGKKAGLEGKSRGNGVSKGAPGPAKSSPAPDNARLTGEGQQSPVDIDRRSPAPEVLTQFVSSAADGPGHNAAHGEHPGQGGREGAGSAHARGTGGGTGLKGAGSGGEGAGGGSPGGHGIQGGSDYYYIRETVMKNIKYPEKARRMGQEGRVVLSFIVLESGATSEVKVVDSCGFRLLDESAKEGVMKTTMQKKVPYRVVVTLPITYRLQ